ncbi:hypothetical protein BD289DRAFT_62677 [Coniella lustricola]|uniref:Uncharacterized protein n=1 Tax=Coniella lustricola TaxID=2025994 RepID=A0A2T3A0C4_9PEZI|nr:hypothetical protein BD289DRAFT_62677 [Coniella lustricola]
MHAGRRPISRIGSSWLEIWARGHVRLLSLLVRGGKDNSQPGRPTSGGRIWDQQFHLVHGTVRLCRCEGLGRCIERVPCALAFCSSYFLLTIRPPTMRTLSAGGGSPILDAQRPGQDTIETPIPNSCQDVLGVEWRGEVAVPAFCFLAGEMCACNVRVSLEQLAIKN